MKKQKEEFVQLKTKNLPKKKIAFVGWKKVYLMNAKGNSIGYAIVKLHIPTSADRIQAKYELLNDRNTLKKIRVSEAKVMEIIPFDMFEYKVWNSTICGGYYTRKYKATKKTKAVSLFNNDFEYKKGKILKEILDPRNIACASGIHCFALRSSAESYSY